MDSDQRRGSDLVRRYFVQLMEGCGRSGCPNRHCFSCVDGPGRLDRTQAALRSLELAQGNEHLLCDELPPFLHLTLVQRLVATALASNDPRPLVKEVAGVFSNADALNRSFLLCDAERKQMAAALSVGVDDTAGISTVAVRRRHRHRRPANAWACVRLRTAAGHRALHWWWGACRAPALSRSPPAPAAYPPAHPLRVHRASDAPPRHLRPRAIEPPPRAPSHPLAPPPAPSRPLDPQVEAAYHELLRLQSAEVLAALMNATESLLCKLQVAQLSQPAFVTDGVALRQFLILLLNPLLLEPQFHKQIVLPLLSLTAALPPPCAERFAQWLSLLPPSQVCVGRPRARAACAWPRRGVLLGGAACERARTYVCAHVCARTYVCARECARTYVCARECARTYVCAHVCARIYVCACECAGGRAGACGCVRVGVRALAASRRPC